MSKHLWMMKKKNSCSYYCTSHALANESGEWALMCANSNPV